MTTSTGGSGSGSEREHLKAQKQKSQKKHNSYTHQLVWEADKKLKNWIQLIKKGNMYFWYKNVGMWQGRINEKSFVLQKYVESEVPRFTSNYN